VVRNTGGLADTVVDTNVSSKHRSNTRTAVSYASQNTPLKPVSS
jgi:hypothetical protein